MSQKLDQLPDGPVIVMDGLTNKHHAKQATAMAKNMWVPVVICSIIYL